MSKQDAPDSNSMRHVETDVVFRKTAAYATLTFEDDSGRQWTMTAASFYFDMKPVDPAS